MLINVLKIKLKLKPKQWMILDKKQHCFHCGSKSMFIFGLDQKGEGGGVRDRPAYLCKCFSQRHQPLYNTITPQ